MIKADDTLSTFSADDGSGLVSAPVKFSFVVPVYANDPGGYMNVSRCLDSLAKQTDKSFEVIMVNDGHDTTMFKVYEGYKKEVFEKGQLRYIEVPYRGIRGGHASCNTGIQMAKGEYVYLLNGDNTVTPDFVETMYLPENAIVFGWVMMNDSPGRIVTTALSITRTSVDRANYAIKTHIAKRAEHRMHLDSDYDFVLNALELAESCPTHNVNKVIAYHN